MKKLTLILALAIVAAFSTVAVAEVQNVKVSGDIAVYQTKAWYDTFYRDATAANISNADYFWMQTTGVNIDADLTENVGGRIRLVNMRPWDYDDADGTAMDIGIAESYIVLREMLYEPLTLTIGRQPLFYGRGFVVGSNVIDPEANVGIYDQYSLNDAFDAVKAELDFAPWKIDLAYSIIEEENINASDDIQLWLTNVGYAFDNYEGELEAYYVGLRDRDRGETTLTSTANAGPLPGDGFTAYNLPAYETHTFGLRGSAVPVENLTLFGEAAYQVGELGDANLNASNNIVDVRTADVAAWGAEVGGEYAFNVTADPKVGICYSFREGENFNINGYATGDYQAFYTPFMRRSDTAIFGHNGRYGIGGVGTAAPAAGVPSNLYYKNGNFANSVDDDDTAWDTNMHQLLVIGSLKPLAFLDVDDVVLGAKYAHFAFVEKPIDDVSAETDAGDELDLTLTYDYTEDVQFSLLYAYFWPGDYYDRGQPNTQADAANTMLLETSVRLMF